MYPHTPLLPLTLTSAMPRTGGSALQGETSAAQTLIMVGVSGSSSKRRRGWTAADWIPGLSLIFSIRKR